MWRELAVSRFGFPGNWGEQGADAGLYENSDIWGIRILILEPVSDVVSQEARATSPWAATPRSASASSANSRAQVRRERTARAAARSRRQSRHQLPGQGARRRRLDVPDARQQRHGAQHGPDLAPGAARRGPQQLRRLPRPQPAADAVREDRRRQAGLQGLGPDRQPAAVHHEGERSLRPASGTRTTAPASRFAKGVKDVEFHRDIKPILERSCVACHSVKHDKPAGRLALDDDRPDHQARPGAVGGKRAGAARAAAHLRPPGAVFLGVPVAAQPADLDGATASASTASTTTTFPVRRSTTRTRRTCSTGATTASAACTTSITPAAPCRRPKRSPARTRARTASSSRSRRSSDEDKLTLARWIDIGCPIDRDYDPQRRRARPRLAARRRPADA